MMKKDIKIEGSEKCSSIYSYWTYVKNGCNNQDIL